MRFITALLLLLFAQIAFAGGINNPGGGSGTSVSSFSGDGALISNSASTGAVTATLGSAAAQTIWGRDALTGGTPSYLTSPKALGTVFGFLLSTTTYPIGRIIGTTTNASGTNPYPFPERSSVFLGAAAGKLAIETNICSGGNVGIGNYALNGLSTGQQCYFVDPTFALAGNGVQNVAIGDGAMYGLDVSSCTADGGFGSENVAIGSGALSSSTCGYRNIAVGESNSTVITTGYFNIVIGTDAVHSVGGGGAMHESTVVGTQNCYSCSGNYTVSIGAQTMLSATTGQANTVIGAFGATTLTTGQDNILLGPTMDVPTGATSYSLNIGNILQGDWTNSSSIGNKTLYLTSPANSVDYLQLTGAATANPATVTATATGSDSNVNLNLVTKGSGVVKANGTAVLTANQTITLSGDVTGSGTTAITTTIAANAVTLAKLATQAANSVLVNATSGVAVPTAQVVSSCSSASSALIWTTNTGFGCNTSITAAAVPASGLTGTTLASGVTASSLTSTGALTPGGNLTMGTNSVTMTGSLATTGARVTKGWFTDMESTNCPTIGGTSCQGSGGIVRATTPTLTTPVLGAATATSINFGGTSLANYVEGTWTPTDNSGAALSLTVTSATYTRIGRVIYVQANITYPTTVSGSNASLAGLPVGLTVAANSGATAVVGTGASIAARVYFTPGTLTMTLLQVVGSAPVTNTQLSGATVQFIGFYFL